ncbi:putative protein WALLS ARE THIN 1 [Iris pallida]|uniref:WAT1-related protein n=1 Tax=Iris pallida TaxID=29817 RepID=A0AAX6DMH0_IRIPA|nr:putative protein WALLS ARE THIN 1 [Iris pallida]
MKNWTLGCVYLIGHCLSWSGWLVLQAPLLKKYPARLSVTSYTCFFGVLQFLVIAAFIERDSSAWKFHSAAELFTILYAVSSSSMLSSSAQQSSVKLICTVDRRGWWHPGSHLQSRYGASTEEVRSSLPSTNRSRHWSSPSWPPWRWANSSILAGKELAVQCSSIYDLEFVLLHIVCNQPNIIAYFIQLLYFDSIIGAVLIIAGLYFVLWGKSKERAFAAAEANVVVVVSSSEHDMLRPSTIASSFKASSMNQPLLPSENV